MHHKLYIHSFSISNQSLQSCDMIADELLYEEKLLKRDRQFVIETASDAKYEVKLIDKLRHPKYDTKMFDSERFQ